jgi:anti-anti-sigma regulatory factor
MDCTITSSVDGDVLVVTNQGRVTVDDALAMAERHFNLLSKSNQTKILVDIRKLEKGISFGETYFLV